MWFLFVIILVFMSSVMVVLIRIENKKDQLRIEEGDLTADDFEILE